MRGYRVLEFVRQVQHERAGAIAGGIESGEWVFFAGDVDRGAVGAVPHGDHDFARQRKAGGRTVAQAEHEEHVPGMALARARVYAADVRAVLQQLSGATQKVTAYSDDGGLLNLAVLPTFGTLWLIPRLGDFAAHQPEVTVNITVRSEPFDFAQEPLDAAIHFGAPLWAGAVCEYLMYEQVMPVCSPAYQAQHGIAQVQDLSTVVLLQQTTRPTQWADWFEQVDTDGVYALRYCRVFWSTSSTAAAGPRATTSTCKTCSPSSACAAPGGRRPRR